jgi:hypothetical protein
VEREAARGPALTPELRKIGGGGSGAEEQRRRPEEEEE